MINKDDFNSLTFRSLSITQRYLFCGIMLYADDDGIIPLEFIQSNILSHDKDITIDDVIKDLKELEKHNFLTIYRGEDGFEYVWIQGWWERQFVDLKTYKMTKHPKPDKYLPRPENMTTWKTSREFLEQKRREQYSKEEITLEENTKEKFDPDEDLPFNS
jgi:hypothetical protein